MTIPSHPADAPTPEAMRGHDEPCWYCKERCSSLAGNPGLWPLLLPLDEARPGYCVVVHTGCVLDRLKRADAFAAAAVERERERCAALLDRRAAGYQGFERSGAIFNGYLVGEELQANARRIRSGEQP